MNETLATAVESVAREPKVLGVLKYPNPLLSKPSAPVLVGSNISADELKNTLDDMAATLRAYRAVGLAAVQVGVLLRMLVVRTEDDSIIKVVNPRIVEASSEKTFTHEGCLSFPGLFLRISRPEEVVVEFFDEELNKKTTANDGLVARAIVHEMDHLDGKTFLDRISNVERQSALRKMKLNDRRTASLVKKLTGK